MHPANLSELGGQRIRKEKKRKETEKTTPFGISLKVLYRAAQMQRITRLSKASNAELLGLIPSSKFKNIAEAGI